MEDENSDIDIEDHPHSSELGYHHHVTNCHNIINPISTSSDINSINKCSRKPRRRRTAFTHAQLAYLERKFR